MSFISSKHPIMKSSVLVLLLACGYGTTDGFQQSASCSSHRVSPLHAEASSDGAALLPPDLQLAMERKNQSRQKFGLKPLSGPQFLELQSQVAELEQQQVLKAQQQQDQRTSSNQRLKQSSGNFIKDIFQQGVEDQCYTNFDCESPKVCCDLGFKKMCCSSGMMEVQHQYALEPVPVDMRE
jgi:hypothetical protein